MIKTAPPLPRRYWFRRRSLRRRARAPPPIDLVGRRRPRLPWRRRGRRGRRLSAALTEAADTEALGDREESVEVCLLDLHLAVVHEVQDVAQVRRSDVAKNHHWIGSGVGPRGSSRRALK